MTIDQPAALSSDSIVRPRCGICGSKLNPTSRITTNGHSSAATVVTPKASSSNTDSGRAPRLKTICLCRVRETFRPHGPAPPYTNRHTIPQRRRVHADLPKLGSACSNERAASLALKQSRGRRFTLAHGEGLPSPSRRASRCRPTGHRQPSTMVSEGYDRTPLAAPQGCRHPRRLGASGAFWPALGRCSNLSDCSSGR